jgi:hypothetical protein
MDNGQVHLVTRAPSPGATPGGVGVLAQTTNPLVHDPGG